MGQQYDPVLHDGEIVHEGFFIPSQEVLSAYASPNFHLTRLNDTTLQVVADTGGDEQVSVTIPDPTDDTDARYRYINATISAAIPGGDGTRDVYVTAAENDFSGPPTAPDETDYSFALTIRPQGSPPTTDLYRKVGEVDVVGGAITRLRQTAKETTGAEIPDAALSAGSGVAIARQPDGSLQFSAGAATGLPTLGGAPNAWTGYQTYAANGNPIFTTAQAAANTVLQNKLLAADAQPAVRILGDGKIEWGSGGVSAPDTNLYRSTADTLKTDDSMVVAGASGVTVSGGSVTITAGGGAFTARAATAAGTVVFGSRVSGDSNDRLAVGADGTMTWGVGSATGDVFLTRNSTRSLLVKPVGGDATNTFQVQPSGSTTATLRVDTASGRVGINTAGAPGAPLDVVGLINTSSSFTIGGSTALGASGGWLQSGAGFTGTQFTVNTSHDGANNYVQNSITFNTSSLGAGTNVGSIGRGTASGAATVTMLLIGGSGRPVTVQPGAAADAALVVQGLGSQAGNLITARDNGQNTVWALAPTGAVTITPQGNPTSVITVSGSNAVTTDAAGLKFDPTYTGAGGAFGLRGVVVSATFNIPSGALSEATATRNRPTFNPTTGATISNAYIYYGAAVTGSGGGAVASIYGLYIDNASYGSVVPTTAHGVRIGQQGTAGVSTAYGLRIDQQTGATNNYGIDLNASDPAGIRITGTVSTNTANLAAILLQPTFSGTGTQNTAMLAQATFTIAGATAASLRGIQSGPTFNPGASGVITTALAIGAQPTTGSGAGSIGTVIGVSAAAPTYGTIKPTSATGISVGNYGSASITTAVGLDVATQSGAGTNIGIRVAAGGTYALQLSDTGGTATGGITFGTDTQLYRSAASMLQATAAVTIAPTSNPTSQLVVSGTSTSLTNPAMALNVAPTFSPAGAGGEYRGAYINPTFNPGAAGSMTANIALYVQPATSGTAGGTVGNTYGLFVGAPSYGAIKPTVIARGIQVGNYGVSGLATAVGIDVSAQTTATTTIGVRIDKPTGATSYALQLSDTGGTAAGGITFGTDVQMWRSGAAALSLTGSLAVSGQVGFNGQSPAARPDYTVSNATADRTFDANSTSIDELADVLGTLIADLQAIGLLT